MLVVKIFFTILIVVLCVVITFNSIRFFVRKFKEINAKKKNKKVNEENKEVIEQKDDNAN